MSARENGWHIKADGYMTSEPSFQKITPKKACDAIEFRHVLKFIRFEDGVVADHRTYVPREFLANERAKNRKLREEAEQLRSYEAGYIAMSAVRDKLKAENAKLRKIARLYVQALKDGICGICPHYYDETCPVETYPMRDGCKMYAEMRELGVEVDE